jgi:hypothetical protein
MLWQLNEHRTQLRYSGLYTPYIPPKRWSWHIQKLCVKMLCADHLIVIFYIWLCYVGNIQYVCMYVCMCMCIYCIFKLHIVLQTDQGSGRMLLNMGLWPTSGYKLLVIRHLQILRCVKHLSGHVISWTGTAWQEIPSIFRVVTIWGCFLKVFTHRVYESVHSWVIRQYPCKSIGFWWELFPLYTYSRVAVGLERGPLSPCESKWGATWKKSSGSSLENWD